MVYIGSVGLGIPPYAIKQETVKLLIEDLFKETDVYLDKILPAFTNAEINERQFVIDERWLYEEHSFKERNDRYIDNAIKLSLKALEDCLRDSTFLKHKVPKKAIDLIIFTSSTGIATPSIDVHLLNQGFREDVERMPLWGLGCAGGAISLSRATDYLRAYPDRNVLVICCEFSSLTFQKTDKKISNMIGTALFGDGVGAVLMVGEESPYIDNLKKIPPKIKQACSFTKQNTTEVMGWEVTNSGFEVIFSKHIPELTHTLWKDHINRFLIENKLKKENIDSYLAHPGGIKVLRAMEDALDLTKTQLKNSYDILRDHGNMSSATVFYVLYKWMKKKQAKKSKDILCALGPGFSSEILLLESNENE